MTTYAGEADLVASIVLEVSCNFTSIALSCACVVFAVAVIARGSP
jgi:ABC-type multidrug transport system permease subunit